MSSNVDSKSSASAGAGVSKLSASESATFASVAKAGEFVDCEPKSAGPEKVMGDDAKNAAWQKLYAAAGIAGEQEPVKLSLRCAVYVYAANNGTSPQGSYSRTIESGKGHSLPAAVIPQAVGHHDVRRFMRANTAEAMRFFNKTGVLAKQDSLRARCVQAGIHVEDVVACCDWLDATDGLTMTQSEAQNRLKTNSLNRARYARGGQSLEQSANSSMARLAEAGGVGRPDSPNDLGW